VRVKVRVVGVRVRVRVRVRVVGLRVRVRVRVRVARRPCPSAGPYAHPPTSHITPTHPHPPTHAYNT
jgi:hypothetical protein